MKSALTAEELNSLSQPNDLKSLSAVAVTWLVIGVTLFLCYYFSNPIIYIIGFLLIGRQQHALAPLIHEAAHKRLFSSAKAGNFFGQVFLAAPLFFRLKSYASLHIKHHQRPLGKEDPDLPLTGGYPVDRKSFLRKLLRDALGLSYFKILKYFRFSHFPPKISSPEHDLWAVLIQIILFTVISVFFSPWLYLTHWLLPMVTLLPLLLRIRGVMEHAGYQESEDQSLSTRTIINPWYSLLLAPYNVNYHIEHHLYPGITLFNLPKAHRLLLQRNAIPKQNLYTDFFHAFNELVR